MYRIFLSKNNNVYVNLATEEYLLKHSNENIIFFWQSTPCVVVGKHQNLYAEVNLPHLVENNISIARRLSGGGTVYHDLGNINFTFISTGEEGKLIDFKKQTAPIIKAINDLGIHAALGPRNNIFIGDKKISGNAEHIFRKRILHHGTLLYNSNLDELENCIKTAEHKFADKAVKSVRSVVTNIADHLPETPSIHSFALHLKKSMELNFPGITEYTFPSEAESEIGKLVEEKYTTPKWIYNYSPSYAFAGTVNYKQQSYKVELSVKKGLIESIESELSELNKLKGMDHHFPTVLKTISSLLSITDERELNTLCLQLFY